MEIFLTDTENAESLPRGKVLEYLQRLDRKLAIRYLEHLINNMRDMTPEFHGRLVSLYLEHIQRTKWVEEAGGAKDLALEQKEQWKDRMLDFLRESKQYRSDRVLSWLPRDDPDFWEARAVVLSNMGQHRAALEIYVFKLNSPLKAEDYCVRIHAALPPLPPTATTTSNPPLSVFHTLLSLYLAPPPGCPQQPQLDNALSILTRHGARLDANEALKLIPEDIQIQKLEGYFEARIRGANSDGSESMIKAQLGKGVMWSCEEKVVGLRARKVIIGEARVCPICHKRLGKSVISVFPDGTVVHYGCGTARENGKEKE